MIAEETAKVGAVRGLHKFIANVKYTNGKNITSLPGYSYREYKKSRGRIY
jgi:hypothetical protein